MREQSKEYSPVRLLGHRTSMLEDTRVSQPAEYDAIAEAYQNSKRLPFREYVERYTLFDMLGDVRGKEVLDVACGEGFYTRLIKQAGAAEVTGVDISAAMIQLAEQEERRHPLGCRYLHWDVAQFEPSRPVDVVVAMYLLSYASSREMLHRFCQVCCDALRPGGRLVGIKDNIHSLLGGRVSPTKYGIERTFTAPLTEGDAVPYTLTNEDGQTFSFTNFFFKSETYQDAFRAAGFREFEWVPVAVHPSQRTDPFWNDFLRDPPLIAFSALK